MPLIEVELGEVATLWLNRPERRNAMTPEMGRELEAAVNEVNADARVRVLVVRGRGEAFSAGGDFSIIERAVELPPERNRERMLSFYESFLSILKIRVPTVAVLHGAAVGAGLCFAAACDLRYSALDAHLALNFVRIGLHPGMAATLLIPRLVGASRARDLLLTGRRFAGAEAEAIGLVHRAVPAEKLDERVEEVVTGLCRAGPLPLAQLKATLLQGLLEDLPKALEREVSSQLVDFASQDVLESIAAFRESRRPVFLGR